MPVPRSLYSAKSPCTGLTMPMYSDTVFDNSFFCANALPVINAAEIKFSSL